MARNGSGTMSVPNDNFLSGTVISSSEMDANFAAIETALTQSIAVDGQSVVTGNIPLATHKLTGVSVGSAATDSANLRQIQAEAFIWCGTAGGSANAITLTPAPAIAAYAAGQRFVWMASGSVNTGATTVAISGLGTIALQENGAALVAGNHAASKMFMGILNTTSTVQIMQFQSAGTATSVGTLTALQVDNININGNTVSSTAGTDLNITPLSGQQIVLDGTIVVDAGVVTGATSIASTEVVLSGALIKSVTNSITAGSTQSQAGATALTTDINRVVTVGTDGDGVKLPTAVAGAKVEIINDDAAQTIQIWPATGDAIDGGSANAVDANALAAGSDRTYFSVDATNWYTKSSDEVAASSTVAGIVELATTAEVNTGSDDTRAITPAGLTAWTGDTGVVTVGTIGTGVWQGTAINQTYLTGQSGTNTGDEIAASLTASGVIEIATEAEHVTGTDESRASTVLGTASVVQDGKWTYVAGGGSADVQTLTLVPAVGAYVAGQRFQFLPTADNTGACTLNVSGLGAKNIKKSDGAGALANPAAGDLDTVLVADVIYDGTQFVLQNPGVAAAGGGIGSFDGTNMLISSGGDAGDAITDGTNNIFLGEDAGGAMTVGDYNIAIGHDAFNATTTSNGSNNNVAIGNDAMGTGISTGANNVAIGQLAGDDLTSGASNVLLGKSAGANITTGVQSIAIGLDTMGTGVVTGANNIAMGNVAGNDLTSANDSILIGTQAGTNITTAQNSIAFGELAMGVGTVTGTGNIAIGQAAAEDLTSANGSIFIGNYAGQETTTSTNSIAIGYQAMGIGVTTGADNVCIGRAAGADLTGGVSNVFLGVLAGTDATGNNMVAIGNSAGSGSTTIDDCVLIGRLAGSGLTDGNRNIMIGRSAGANVDGGARNTYIGDAAGNSGVGGANNTCIGATAELSSSSAANEATFGNTSVATSRVQVDWTVLSDERDKANIESLAEGSGLAFINDLRPVSYQSDVREKYFTEEEVLWRDADGNLQVDSDGNETGLTTTIRVPYTPDGSKRNTHRTTSFLAQEVLQTIADHGEEGLGDLVLATNPDKLELQRSGLIVPLVKALQQLSAKHDALQVEHDALVARVLLLENA